jgi:hypothetical protein
MDGYAAPVATLNPPVQAPGAQQRPAPILFPNQQATVLEPDEDNLVTDLAASANTSVPFAGIGKTLIKYIANKVAAKGERKNTPIDIARLLDEKTGKAWRDWLPETLWDYLEVKEDQVWRNDLIMATQVAVTNIDVFEDWTLFYAVCVAFNERRVNFEWLDKPSYMECALACHWLRALRPNTSFGPGVIRFICAVMMEDGLVYFPWTGGDGIALGGPEAECVRGMCDCKELAADMRRIWSTTPAKTMGPAEHIEVDEKDPHNVQLAKLMNGESYIRANCEKDPSQTS